jgi:predicted RNase H-like HicB family nuclease
MKYIYPAIFHKQEDIEGYWVEFPDLEGCFSQGETFEQAFMLSKEALSEYLIALENDNVKIPIPSKIENFNIDTSDILNLVDTNTLEYRKEADIKSIKKTLTIPSWLNEIALSRNLNFSKVLQKALKFELGVE